MLFAVFLLAFQGAPPATVLGEVRDADTGRPLVNATVVLTNLNLAVTTGDSGRYALHQVPAGPQHITYRRIGYAPRTLDALVPREGNLEISVTLEPRPVQLPPLTVNVPAPDFGLARGDHGYSVDRAVSLADMRNHPLLAEPDALQALAGGEIIMDPESPSGVHIRGGNSDQTAYLLDGIPILSPYHVAGTFSAWNPDALAALEVSMSNPAPGLPDAMSGVVSASTRTPGDRHLLQGSISTSQVRATLDGPIAGQTRYLLSGRTGFVPGFSSGNDVSFLGAVTGDWLGKVEAPIFGGQARLLGYYTSNDISADAAGGEPANPDILRNDFSWRSQSVGGEYSGGSSRARVRALAWSARTDANALWNGTSAVLDLDAFRHDAGVLLSATLAGDRASLAVGMRMERSRTRYTVRSDSAGLVLPDLKVTTPVITLFGEHARPWGDRFTLIAGASLSRAAGRNYLSPRGQLRFQAGPTLALIGSASRLHQFGQSLRNPESVVGYVFPADLYMGGSAPTVPVARSDQVTLGAEVMPVPGLRIDIHAYSRRLTGILLVALGEAEPFSTGTPPVGRGYSRGAALRVSISARRYSLIGSYGIQRVRIGDGDSSYTPHYGATHQFEGGIIVYPTATSSIRVGASGALDRRTTIFSGSLEWEACNLLDQGCEFGGSPHYGQDPLGGSSLPAYFRVDASIRKHWHIRFAGREAMLGVFGTATNLLGRRNLLTYARHPQTGDLTEIEMRPLSPLVVGLDWRF